MIFRSSSALRLYAGIFAFTCLVATASAETTLADVQALIKQGQYKTALARVDELVAAKPKDSQARFAKGVILTELNRPSEAIQVYQKLTEDYPTLPEPYNNLAAIYASQKQYEKARDALEQAIRTHPAYATAHENLADIYAKLASQAYDKALQLDSSNAQAQTKLATIRDMSGTGYGRGMHAAAPVVATAPASKPVAAIVATPPATVTKAAPGASKPIQVAAASPVKSEPAAKPAEKNNAQKAPKPETASSDTATVSQAVRDWASAWSRKDVRAYLGFYAKDFRTPNGQTRRDWEDEREARIKKPGPIEISVASLKVSIDGDTATVHFRQAYSSTNLKTTSSKTLVLARRGSRWQILQERVGA